MRANLPEDIIQPNNIADTLLETCVVCHASNAENFCAVHDRLLETDREIWQIRRCRDCGFGWTLPHSKPESFSRHYPDGYYGETEKTIEEFLSGKLARTRSWRGEMGKVRLVGKYISGGRILDVGCGEGKFLWALDGRRWSRTGVEPSKKTLDLVKSRLQGLRLIPGTIGSHDLDPESFDAITFWHVLEHIPDTPSVLRRAASLLRPGGWIFISLPNFDSLQAKIFRKYWYHLDVPRHIYHFSKSSLDLLLEQVHFSICQHLSFSRDVNFHSLKHSLLSWSEDRFGSCVPYYLLKPGLFIFSLIESLSGKSGILTTIARKVK
jgi:2-polyprenyl-3-methyl-5-hydroxy-6-metoxy-1,4-benzoquinol methylase